MEKQRVLPIQQGFNFRELGGYQTKDGHTVKWQKLLRSGGLDSLTQTDLAYLDQYGVRYDIDFRSPKEVLDSPDRVPGQAKYQYAPVFNVDETKNSDGTDKMTANLETHPDSGYRHMLKVYRMIANEAHAKYEYRRFFDSLLANDQPDDVLLFHCTAGKDRTGMGAVYLLSALGVDQATIRQDYLLTNTASADRITSAVQAATNQGASAATIASIKALWSVNEDYLDTALAEIKRQSGNVEHYLRTELNLTKQEMSDLRKIYLN
ncbi:protein-tyrosine-phosphatase [Lactobacillus sp. CBA3605]|uniref:tyrosine-protein phosphatase n=1 Tax=Lactobacillus sp. CBA3605 TaxID=2099788 RepID=UPI000CFDCCC4|nr:tyrosine-protein phosphatase [Lactobacillus sp. CBA3605]AVK60997.1 protein-tyrosine-phosphatase [Lactobacillus sp. CBA3605]